MKTPEEIAKHKRDRDLNDIRKVISTPEGRRFYWRLLGEGMIFKDGYVHGDAGYGTTFNAGRRKVGLWALVELMDAKPEAYAQMQNEFALDMKIEEAEIKKQVENKDILQ